MCIRWNLKLLVLSSFLLNRSKNAAKTNVLIQFTPDFHPGLLFVKPLFGVLFTVQVINSSIYLKSAISIRN